MKDIKVFVLTGCPYCRKAKQAYDELTDGSAYKDIHVDWINEDEHPEIAGRYDYYYCPTMYVGQEKVYEAHPGQEYDEIKENVERVLRTALNA